MRSSVAVMTGVAGVALGAGFVWLRSQNVARDLASEREAAAELRRQLRGVTQERDSLRSQPGAMPVPASDVPHEHPRTAAPKVSADDPVTRQELVRLLNEKNEKIAAGDDALRDLRFKLQEAESRAAQLAAEQAKLTETEGELKERLAASTRLAESLQTEVTQRNERLARVEVANQDLRKRSEESARRAAKAAQLVAEMKDLAQRQDSYLDNILRRYREATDQFRTLAVRLENPRDTTAPAGTGTDLSRIQQTIALAEDDLRQFRSLNSQARRLERELAAAR